jgi:hypothetical protein
LIGTVEEAHFAGFSEGGREGGRRKPGKVEESG